MRFLILNFIAFSLPLFGQTPAEVRSQLEKVVAWQTKNAWDVASYNRRHQHDNHPRGWTYGALYVGMERWAETVGDEKTLNWLKAVAEKENYGVYPKKYHADHHTVAQLYLELYRKFEDPRMIQSTQQLCDWILENPSKEGLDLAGYTQTQRWTWCDALFMSPPIWAKLSTITGDKKYSDFMLAEFKATTGELFDAEENFYYRDHSYIKPREDGKKIFWSRGNGWVFAALPLLMEEYPKDSEEYQYFASLFLKMAPALKTIQTDEGHWAMSLLNAEKYPTPETSGTAFFTFGLAWGINEGLLNREEYLPTIKKAWDSLSSHIHPDGMLGYVQTVGAGPGLASPRYTEVYGVGALLAAGSELLELLKAHEEKGFAFARFVPERSDDFAFENDKIAFRIYGPALKDAPERSGIDLWLKRTDQPIINKWYANDAKGISYHTDHGEGYDPYKVGASLGGGGLGVWHQGQLLTANVFESYEILKNDGRVSSVKFQYVYELDGKVINEERAYTLEAGSHFFSIESNFTAEGKPMPVEVALGLTTHDGKAAAQKTPDAQWLSCWEEIDGSHLGTAVILPNGQEARSLDHVDKDTHALLLTKTDDAGKIRYQAGFAWEKSGAVDSLGEWISLVEGALEDVE